MLQMFCFLRKEDLRIIAVENTASSSVTESNICKVSRNKGASPIPICYLCNFSLVLFYDDIVIRINNFSSFSHTLSAYTVSAL